MYDGIPNKREVKDIVFAVQVIWVFKNLNVGKNKN